MSSTSLAERTLVPIASRKRLDVQALRALAVVLVVVYHAFPTALPGGFIGVDVFFVISGFLITLLLLRELDATGRINIRAFYARRVRRLMPAALVVTVATVAVSAFVVGPVRLIAIVEDAMWATAYLANVRFGMSPDGYFVDGEKSPLLHFWSLAVEEQFYFVWPILLIALVALFGVRWKRALPAVLAAIVVSSLAASVILTDSGWGHAYFSLATRAWELALGALVAHAVFSGVRLPKRHWAASAGLAGVIWAAFTYSEATAFPGVAAVVPTVGAALLVWAGASGAVRYEQTVGWRPIQFLGDVSYSLYLWHWPVFILGGLVLGPGWAQSGGLLVLSLLLAATSYYLVEKRLGSFRRHWSSHRVVMTGAMTTIVALAAGALIIISIPVAGGPSTAAADPVDASGEVVSSRIVPSAPEIMTPEVVPSNLLPSLADLADDLAPVFTNGCFAAELVVCEGGDPAGSVRIVLAGDSHAGQWWPAADAAAKVNGWQLFMVGKNGCPLAFVNISRADTSEDWPECTEWQREAADAVVDLDADVIVYANNVGGYSLKMSVREDFDASWAAGVQQVLVRFADSATVVSLGQQPRLPIDPGGCLAENLQDVAVCSTPREDVVSTGHAALIEALAEDSGAYYVDVVDLLCTETCPLIDHNLLMYRDASHLSRTYAEFLSPQFAAMIKAALGSG